MSEEKQIAREKMQRELRITEGRVEFWYEELIKEVGRGDRAETEMAAARLKWWIEQRDNLRRQLSNAQ
jgi:hypothetical protein